MSHLEFDWESPVWSHLLTELSRQHTLVRYDERGCGLSDWDVPDLSFEAWVGDLETVVDATGVDRFPLLHGGYARGRLRRGADARQHEEAETMNKLAELGWGQENPAFRQFFTTQVIPGGTADQHRWFNELERISTSPANAGRFMRVFNEIDVVPLLPKVSCPTLVLHCVRDARVPFAEGRLIAGLIPGARFVPLESDNHLLLDNELMWSRWIDELRGFLPAHSIDDPAFAALTPRELELIELIAQGRDNTQIAAQLDLSVKTVRNHITSIFAKLEVENRSQAIVLARDAGFGKQAS